MTIAQSAKGDSHRWAALVVALLLPLAGGLAFPPAAGAATTMTSYVGFAYDSSSNTPPSADKPQSKLWFHAAHWWALMLTPDAANVGDVHIFQLQPDHTWRDTGVAVDSRANATGDALPDGDKLYVVSRQSGSDIRVARFGYDDAKGTYAATGSPTTITQRRAPSRRRSPRTPSAGCG
ncbi:MAG TPA: hypothetical protein VKP64_16515 [Mycobacteriales bacterium]|nr:hypothetical protein [Mycobacteriales bacterium]